MNYTLKISAAQLARHACALDMYAFASAALGDEAEAKFARVDRDTIRLFLLVKEAEAEA